MGTDIHPIVQVRREGTWQNVTIPEDGRYGNILDGRWYDLFAILGNVRNGRGFAGVVTGSGFVPISDCRGIPEDAGFTLDDSNLIRCAKHRIALPVGGTSSSTELAVPLSEDDEDDLWDCRDCVWLGDHSHTWVTLRELNEYDWDAPVAKAGVMHARFRNGSPRWPGDQSYEEWMKSPTYLTAMPDSYAGGIDGPGIRTVPEVDYVNMLRAGTLDPSVEYVVSFARSMTVRQVAGMSSFLADEGPLGWLRSLGEPDDVRIVMGFDS